MVEDGRPEASLRWVEEANGFLLLNPLKYYLARCIIPEGLLRQRAKATVVSGLQTRHNRLARLRIDGKKSGMGNFEIHRFLLPSKLARMPSAPAAPKSNGAKIGGPYMML